MPNNTRQLLVFLLFSAGLFNISTAHDIDVTGVARILLYEQLSNEYQLSIVDQQVPPLYNIENVLPDRCESLEPSGFSYKFS